MAAQPPVQPQALVPRTDTATRLAVAGRGASTLARRPHGGHSTWRTPTARSAVDDLEQKLRHIAERSRGTRVAGGQTLEGDRRVVRMTRGLGRRAHNASGGRPGERGADVDFVRRSKRRCLVLGWTPNCERPGRAMIRASNHCEEEQRPAQHRRRRPFGGGRNFFPPSPDLIRICDEQSGFNSSAVTGAPAAVSFRPDRAGVVAQPSDMEAVRRSPQRVRTLPSGPAVSPT